MPNLKLSVVIPVYNVEKYLSECLNSVLSQDMFGVEIILIDDGSSDGSGLICDNYSKEYDFISCIHQTNKGLSAARNVGILEAKGEFVVLLDSDDMLNGNAIAEILRTIETNGSSDIILGKAMCFEGDLQNKKNSKYDLDNYKKYDNPRKIFYKLLKNKAYWFAAWLCIVKREFIIKNGLFFKEGIYHEDELWVPQIFLKAERINLLDCDFYCYRVNRNGSIISNKNIKKEFDKFVIIDKLFSELNGLDKYGKKIIQDRLAALEWGLIRNFKFHKNHLQANSLVQGIKERLKFMNYGKYKLIKFYLDVVSLEKYLEK